jgi:hypothetical protein
VNWNTDKERNEAITLLNTWEPIDEEQALALLAGYFCINDINSHMRCIPE